MFSKLEKLVTTAATLFLISATTGLGGNLEFPETQVIIVIDLFGAEVVKDRSKDCDSPSVPPKSNS